MDTRNFVRVDVVVDYWDQPREGLAMFDGQPHYFKSEFDTVADDYADTYVLVPVSSDLADRIKGAWQAWLNWRRAFDRGEAGLNRQYDTGDDSLTSVVSLIDMNNERRRAVGRFVKVDRPDIPQEFSFEVEWVEVRD